MSEWLVSFAGRVRYLSVRLGMWAAVAGLVTLSTTAPDAQATGPFPVPHVASITFTLPSNILLPTTQNFNCLARTDDETSGGLTPIRALCYNADAPSQPPPPPEPYAPVRDLEFNGIVRADGSLFVALIPCVFIESPATALRIWLDAQLSKTPGPVSGTVTVRENTGPDVEQLFCAEGTETTGPLTVTPLALNHNGDGDGCTTLQELGPNPGLGGQRDPFNPWDYYDVLGSGGGPPDGVIDLANDILGVIQHFAARYPPGTPSPVFENMTYDDFDRSPSAGPNSWNMTAPDGAVDLANDILGVILQFQHNCA